MDAGELRAELNEQVGPVGRFFLWCAGSDPRLLETPAERTKHIGFGTLVVVPAVLALFAMTYAISTLTDRWWITALAGMAWALIVFAFDRFVVSTYRKSTTLWRDLHSPVFLTRLVLAGFIGVIVAHPLVLLYFDDSIEERLDRERATRGQQIGARYQEGIDGTRAEVEVLRREIAGKEAQRLEAQQVLRGELGGIDSEQTTGRYGRGIAAEAQEELRDMAVLDLERLRARLPGLEAEVDERVARLETERAGELAAVPQARDYVARTRAMEVLAAESIAFASVRWFLILFFVFVDTLPVLFKVMTPRGPYDERLGLQELTVTVETGTARERLQGAY